MTWRTKVSTPCFVHHTAYKSGSEADFKANQEELKNTLNRLGNDTTHHLWFDKDDGSVVFLPKLVALNSEFSLEVKQ